MPLHWNVPDSNCAQSESNACAALTPDPSPIRWARGTARERSSPSSIWLALTLTLSPGERESPGLGTHSLNHTFTPSARNRSAK